LSKLPFSYFETVSLDRDAILCGVTRESGPLIPIEAHHLKGLTSHAITI
jgi:hypothetical protein